MNNQTQLPVELEISCFGSIETTKVDTADFSASLKTIDISKLEFLTIDLGSSSSEDHLLEIVVGRLDRAAKLRRINLRCSARGGTDIPQSLTDLQQYCQDEGIGLVVDFLLPDDADGFAAISGSPSQFLDVLTMSRQLVSREIAVCWVTPVSRNLVFHLEGLFSLARNEGVEPFLLRDDSENSAHQLTANERLFLFDFISYRILGADRFLLTTRQEAYYLEFLRVLTDQHVESNLGNRSSLFYPDATNSWNLEERSAPLISGQLTLPLKEQRVERFFQKWRDTLRDISDVLVTGVLAHVLRFFARDCEKRKPLAGRSFKKALLIGAYGGEHIGDAAILGGVLCRINERFGVTEAVLMTQRLSHSRHLIPMLDVPVNVTVDIYERSQIHRYVDEADCVVFAGGPLIDLPKQLVRHLYTASLACRKGMPFIMEGIGPGPFARSPSLFTANRLIKMADSISLRSSDSRKHALVRDLPVNVGLCPAFDYLETRPLDLTRIPDDDIASIEELLKGTEGRPIIGVNVRPIGHLYTVGAPEGDATDYTRRIEQQFEHQFAEGLRTFHEESANKPCFVYFPMNAIQFGMSDLLSAYRIQRQLGSGVDFRVWQADASLDGVLALLRQCDITIAMRFHAAIFALSQNCRVIGIDYRIGKKDKVAGLLDDVGQGENCVRIDLLTENWLAQKLSDLSKLNAT